MYKGSYTQQEEDVHPISLIIKGKESIKTLIKQCTDALDIIDVTRESRIEEAKKVYMFAVVQGRAHQADNFIQYIKDPHSTINVRRVYAAESKFIETVNIHGLNAYSVKRKALCKLLYTAKYSQAYEDVSITIPDTVRAALMFFDSPKYYNKMAEEYTRKINELTD